MDGGRVYLVGAGPGDPGLMTVRGLEVLRTADVIVYDRLVNPALLDEAPPAALRLFAGKRAGGHCLPQDEINARLIEQFSRGDVIASIQRTEQAEPVFDGGALSGINNRLHQPPLVVHALGANDIVRAENFGAVDFGLAGRW